ncbi:hypothetical protein G7085_09780 [Tessaracoccus sp. HDW20]|uniref:hypothetical protein n=1 Tax=Tessaracoccus coleopterorum TaxID=2714950 RepID=UPI0018D3BFFA|nr:hypothetical protein [Tessaracoccus coleopterorum]NHB84795.1 hypothetical protein [Tessaracoccus coleopterorum]
MSQNTSSRSSTTPASVRRLPSSRSIRRTAGQPSPTSASASSRSGPSSWAFLSARSSRRLRSGPTWPHNQAVADSRSARSRASRSSGSVARPDTA